MPKPLTDAQIRNAPLPAKGKRSVLKDNTVRGLTLRVTASGQKVFSLKYSLKGRDLRYTIGEYGKPYSLAEARLRAAQAIVIIKQGRDPRTDAAFNDLTPGQALLAAAPATAQEPPLEAALLPPATLSTFDEATALFLRRHCARKNKPSTAAETKRLLSTHFKDWQDRPLASIQKSDIIDLIDEIIDRGTPSAARHAYTAIRTFFTWCTARNLISTNPTTGIDKPPAGPPRTRALKAAELKNLSQTARALGYPIGTYLEILLITGQRRREVAGMRWSEIDYEENLWKLPGTRTKNRIDNYIPLTPRLHALLRSIPRQQDCDFLFPAHGFTDRAFSCFSDIKSTIDTHSGVTGWRLHDIRRTLSTTMGFLEVPQTVIDKILNHKTLKGARAVYQLYEHLNEKDEALRRWQAHLKKLAKRTDQPAPRRHGRRSYPTAAAI